MTAHVNTTTDDAYALAWDWAATDSAVRLRNHLNAAIDYPGSRPDFRITHTQDGTVGVTLHSAGLPDLDIDSKLGALRDQGISFSVTHKKLVTAEMSEREISFGTLVEIADGVVDSARSGGVDMTTNDLMFSSGSDGLPSMLSFEVSAKATFMSGLNEAKYDIVGRRADIAEDVAPNASIVPVAAEVARPEPATATKVQPGKNAGASPSVVVPTEIEGAPAPASVKPSPVPRPRPTPNPTAPTVAPAPVLTIEILAESTTEPAPELLLDDDVAPVVAVVAADSSDFDEFTEFPSDADGNGDF